MKYTKFTKIAFILLAISMMGFTACETNDVSALWDAIYDSNTSSTQNYDSLYKMSVDTKGDVILVGTTTMMDVTPFKEKLLVVKYNVSGAKVWDFIKEFSYGQDFYISDYCLDNENNIYVSGVSNENKTNILVKISSAGQLLWVNVVERQEGWLTGAIRCVNGTVYWAHMDITLVDAATGSIKSTIPVNNKMTDIVSDTSGNIYVAGYEFYASYDAAGTLRFTKTWGSELSIVKLSITAGNLIYASGKVQGSGSTVSTFKINTSGTIIASVNETISNAWNVQQSLDNSGNVIIAASTDGAKVCTVVKYNANLAKTWSKNFTASSDSGDLDQMVTDSVGNIYITGRDLSTKINTSGTKVVSEKDSSYYQTNCIAVSPDNTKMYIGSSAGTNELKFSLSQYNNK